MDTVIPTRVRRKLPKPQALQSLAKSPLMALRELNNRSFFRFLQFMWPEVTAETFANNWHIEYLCNELQKMAEQVANKQPKEHDLIINIPPGTTKTTICMIMFPVWCWTRWYWMKFIALSYSATLSLESAETARELVRSERFRMTYPELQIKDDKDQKGNYQVIRKIQRPGYAPSIKNGGNRYSTSVGGTLTGFHAHIILVDDPINPQQAVSTVELTKTNRWLDSTLPTRKVDKQVTPTVLIMQRLHQSDPSGHLLDKNKGNVRHICLPGEIRNYRKYAKPVEVLDYYKDDLLDPKRLNWASLDELKADLGQYGYAGQVGQTPTPATGGMFEVDKFVTIERPPAPDQIEYVLRYWDKAGTVAKAGKELGRGPAWTVGVKMAKLKEGAWVVLDVKRGRWGSAEREKIIKATAEGDGKSVHVYVEQEPGSGGKESAESTITNLAGFTVFADRPTGDKIYRADPYSVQVNNGKIRILRGDWNKEYMEEHQYFPNSTFKDQVDASSGAFSKLTSKKRARPLGRTRR